MPLTTVGRALDETDRQIVGFLQRDARMANAEIARRLGMAPSAIYDRIRKLEDRGIIDGYEARVNAKAVGLGLTAFIFVRGEDGVGDTKTGTLLSRIPEAQEVHHVAGEDCEARGRRRNGSRPVLLVHEACQENHRRRRRGAESK